MYPIPSVEKTTTTYINYHFSSRYSLAIILINKVIQEIYLIILVKLV